MENNNDIITRRYKTTYLAHLLQELQVDRKTYRQLIKDLKITPQRFYDLKKHAKYPVKMPLLRKLYKLSNVDIERFLDITLPWVRNFYKQNLE